MKKYNLTIPQNNIWLVENFYDDKSINILAGTFTVKTGFNAELAKKTINKFFELNAATRLKFVKEGSTLYQYVEEYKPFEVIVKDISKMTEQESMKLKQELIAEPLDISKNPFNFILLDRKDGYGEFLLKCHHLVSDAWSVSKMGTALQNIYEKFLNNDTNFEKAPSYIDFVVDEQSYIGSDKYIKDEAFWKEYLSNFSEPVGLKSKENLTTNARRFHRVLAGTLTQKIYDFCKNNRLSPYSLFLSAIAIYIHRVTESNDIIIGTPVLNRSNFIQKQIQGMFVATVPVRFKFDGDMSFINFCNNAVLNSMQIFKHQKFPYNKIMKETSKENNNENLFNIAFSYQNARAQINLEKYNIDWIFSEKIQDEVEFHLLDLNDSGHLEFDIDYLTDIFEEKEIEFIYSRILNIIIQGMEQNPSISQIDIISPEEKNAILSINNTVHPYASDKSVIELFEEVVAKHPNDTALIFEDKKMSYAELDRKSNEVAAFLQAQGINSKDRVAICIDKSFNLLIGILAVLKCGATYVPLDANYTDDRKLYILKESNAKLALSDDSFNLNFRSININSVLANYEKDSTGSADFNPCSTSSTSPVCVLYTSGTTGMPKGVEIINRNIIKLVTNITYMDFPEDARILQVASTVFDLSIFEFWASLLNGKALCLITKDNLLNFKYLKSYIDENNINIMCITSVLFNQLVANHIKVFENMKQILTGGDKISTEHVRILKNTYPDIKIYNSYGPTECTSFCTMYEIKDFNSKYIPIGKPISNSAGYVLNSKNELMPFYCSGELAIGGDGVSNGYINNPEKTAEKFIDNRFNNEFIGKKIYKTGDLVRLHPDGNLEFIGRVDNQVKLRGYRIELDEIKSIVLKYPGIENCAIVIKEDAFNKSNKHILIYFTAKEKIDISSLNKYLSKNLQAYMMPSGIMQLEKMPMNSNYKVDTSKLPEIALNTKKHIKPETDIEVDLYGFIQKLLHVEKFSVDDNLFSLGLDSLFAIELANYISEKYKVNISTKLILENNTILNLEEYINEANSTSDNKENIIETNITPGEKSVYLEWLKEPSNTLYNAPFELKLDRNINLDLLKESILKTIHNNKNMCAIYSIKDNEITKSFEMDKPYDIKVENVSDEEYLFIKEDFAKPFNLNEFPLFRINIYVTEKNVYVLLDIHHIIFDGSSFIIFLKEVADRYNGAKVEGKSNTDIYMSVPASLMEASKKFYLEEFAGDLPVNDLPYDKPRDKERKFVGNHISLAIDSKLTSEVNEFIKKHSITLNTFLQSAFSIMLSKYTYSEDIIYGIAYSGRESKALENVVGMFVRTVPYRVNIDWDNDVLGFIENTQKQTLDYMYYSNYSYDNLVKDLEVPRLSNRNALFDVMFVCQNMHIDSFKFGDTTAKFNPVTRNTSKFDFTFEVIPSNDKIDINLEYDVELFSEKNMYRMINHYIHIISEIILKSEANLKDIEMILPEEKKQIEKFSDNKTNYPKKTVCKLFEEQVAKHPNKKAVVFGDTYLTYAELNSKANKIARYLIQNGLKPKQVVAIMIDKSLEYMPAAIAILKCGATYTPIIEDLPDERAKYMIENAKSAFVLTTKKFFRKITEVPEIYIDNEELYNSLPEDNLNLECDIDDVLHIIYTSGSTGVPKGNMIKNRGMVRLLLDTNYIDYTDKDVMVTSASLTFDISGFELWGAMLYGMTLHMLTKEQIMNISYYSNYLIENKITTTFLATPIFHLMVEENVDMFRNMTSIYVGGETLLPKYTNMLFKAYPNIKVYNAYGPAEITVICCAQLIDRIYESYEDLPLGKIVCNNTVYVLDKCQKMCPVNIPGELYVFGDGLGYGYVNREDLTREKFTYIDGFEGLSYRSGDLTKWNDKGEIRFMTRIDKQVKIRGQRIELAEIQNKMLELKELKETVAIVVTNNENKYIIAYYTTNTPITSEEVHDYLAKYLPDYMVPYKLVEVPEIPYTHNGKIDRAKLPKVKFAEEHTANEELTPEEQVIVDAFKTILKTNNIYLDSNFFEVGGDSLAAARLVAELQTHKVYVSYGDIFNYSTPRQIYEYVYLNHINDIMSGKVSKDIDFDRIDKLLQDTCYKGEEVKLYDHIGNVLLTGVTGFLGVHILKELVYNDKVDKVFCLVRDKNNLSSEERFKKQLAFFFEPDIVEKIMSKTSVVNGDISNPNLFNEEFNDKIDIVINSAARVKHYGDYSKFYNVNVLGVKNIIKYCTDHNARLIHISTLSVSGNIIEAGQTMKQAVLKNTHFYENNLYIGQDIENVYVNTKFAAEVEILNQIMDCGLDAKILRLGNLTGRLSDGKFQPNVEDNAFSNRVKALTELHAMPESMYEKYIEMTPIDVVSDAINKIMEISNKNIVYHLFNHNHIPMPYFVKILKSFGVNVEILNKESFTQLLYSYMEDEEKVKIIQGIIPDIAEDGTLEYNDNIIIDSDITKEIMHKVGFDWPTLGEDYIVKYLEYLNKIGFLNLK